MALHPQLISASTSANISTVNYSLQLLADVSQPQWTSVLQPKSLLASQLTLASGLDELDWLRAGHIFAILVKKTCLYWHLS